MPIMYVCEPCQDNCPENCGHDKRDDIRVLSDGTWLCRDCFDNGDMDGVNWSELPAPPEYVPSTVPQVPARTEGHCSSGLSNACEQDEGA